MNELVRFDITRVGDDWQGVLAIHACRPQFTARSIELIRESAVLKEGNGGGLKADDTPRIIVIWIL
jgi:hypothetical protein